MDGVFFMVVVTIDITDRRLIEMKAEIKVLLDKYIQQKKSQYFMLSEFVLDDIIKDLKELLLL